jgi:hypothetical protein
MGTIRHRLQRLGAQQDNPEVVIEVQDGPPMSAEEIDRYNRNRKPDQPFLFTLRIDRRDDAAPLCLDAE